MDGANHPAMVTLRQRTASDWKHRFGISARLLPPQFPNRYPGTQGWAMLPATDGSLVLDLTGQSIITTALLLTDLQIWQQRHTAVPFVLVPPDALAQQRLIAAAQVPSVVVHADQPEVLARWLAAPVQVGVTPTWVGLTPPALPARSPHFVALFAALSRAEHIHQAATWCAMSGRRAYRLLADSARRLTIPPAPWRHPRQWVRLICQGLAQRRPTSAPRSASEVSMHGLDRIAAMLCGCTLERLTSWGTSITLTLVEPRQGNLTCCCKQAMILDDSAASLNLHARPMHARTIDWVDVLHDRTLCLYFPDHQCLRLRLHSAQFERLPSP